MDEIREVANAYYDGAKEEDKILAQQFFKSLYENGDEKITLEGFKKKVGPSFSDDEIFRHLDGDGDGTLDFKEVLGLYYMNKVSIPSCGVCRELLLGSYFSCLRCQGKASYRLCCGCYGGRSFEHHHSSDEFADTRALLKLLEQLMGQERVAPNRRDILERPVVGDNIGDSNGDDAIGAVGMGYDIASRIGEVYEGNEVGVEALVNDTVVEALGEGIDMIETVVELATAVVSSGCIIM